jgi:hypothetical protein
VEQRDGGYAERKHLAQARIAEINSKKRRQSRARPLYINPRPAVRTSLRQYCAISFPLHVLRSLPLTCMR